MADWGTLKTEIQQVLTGEAFQAGGAMETTLLTWANRTVTDVCTKLNIRNHLTSTTSATDINCTTSSYQYDLPDDFLKMDERFTKVRVSDEDDYIEIIGLDELFSYDPDHDLTSTTGTPEVVSFEGEHLYTYPMVSATLRIENYFRQPTDMVAVCDSPDLPYNAMNVVDELVIAGVCKRGYQHLQDFDLMQKYELIFREKLTEYQVHLDKSSSRQVILGVYY